MSAFLLICLLVLDYAGLPVKANKDNTLARSDSLIEETYDLGRKSMDGFLNLSAAAIPAAQASYDFSSDDELENADSAIMDGSGLVASGSAGSVFSGMRREIETYVVANGDTLFDIAIKFGINTDTILWANNLKENQLIRPGQKLVILPINGVRVQIGSKDTVDSLAKKYSGKSDEILAFNNLSDSSKLAAGQYIIIPNGEMPAAKTVVPSKGSSSKNTTLIANSFLILPTTGHDWGKVHGQNGVDVANVCGTPIYAAAEGEIILADGAGWNQGYGKYIMIKHPNGVITLYGHASQLLVEVGQHVEQGEQIALMGTTGRSTGCHLHFEVRGAKNPLAGARLIK